MFAIIHGTTETRGAKGRTRTLGERCNSLLLAEQTLLQAVARHLIPQ